mmetsp:Transcript_9842/g.24891  ORF Transcript_9842/g.24891 Transcript_9842/m.24891 type:complete len:209 (-) Transcript_9842:803-1429(-)
MESIMRVSPGLSPGSAIMASKSGGVISAGKPSSASSDGSGLPLYPTRASPWRAAARAISIAGGSFCLPKSTTGSWLDCTAIPAKFWNTPGVSGMTTSGMDAIASVLACERDFTTVEVRVVPALREPSNAKRRNTHGSSAALSAAQTSSNSFGSASGSTASQYTMCALVPWALSRNLSQSAGASPPEAAVRTARTTGILSLRTASTYVS